MMKRTEKVKSGIRNALSLTFAQAAITTVFSFGAVMIVSRLLTPTEIGIYSVAAGLVLLVHTLRNFGVSEFLVQENEINDEMVSTVFTVNLIVAWSLGIVLFASSGPAGHFYGNVGVSNVLRVLSGLFIIMPFGAVTQAIMTREFEFDSLIKIRLAESVTRSCVTVVLAYIGFSYMSMAWSSLISIVVMFMGCVIWGWKYRVKGLSLKYWRRVVHFGSNRTVADIASQMGEQSANLIVGRMLGMADTGLYSRGFGIVNLFRDRVVGAVNTVAFPAFARDHRVSNTASTLFVRSLVYLTGISWPFFSAGILLALPIIRILFGAQWDASVPLMRWLCGAAIIATLTYQCSQFLVAVGRVREVTQVELKYQATRVVLTVLAAFYSVEAVAAVQVLVYVAATLFYYNKLRDCEGLSLRRFTGALVPSALVTVAACIVPAVVVFWPGLLERAMLPAFCVAVFGGCCGWLVCVVVLRHPLLGELQHVASKVPGLRHFVRG